MEISIHKNQKNGPQFSLISYRYRHVKANSVSGADYTGIVN